MQHACLTCVGLSANDRRGRRSTTLVRGRHPEASVQIDPPVGKELDAFVCQPPPLYMIAAEGPAAREGSAGVHHAMRRQVQALRVGEEGPADLSGPVRLAQRAGDSAVGGDMAIGDLRDGLVDPLTKRCRW